MVEEKTSKSKSLLAVILPILLVSFIGVLIQIFIVSQPEQTTLWLKSFGPYFILVYVLVQSAGIIFPPVPGGVVVLALIAILGPARAFPIIYLVTTPLFCINFLLAKKYGRPFIKKFANEKTMAKVDHYAADAGLGTLILLRFFMGNFFDYLSYGLGLTKISFKHFFWVNLLVGLPGIYLEYYIFSRSGNFLVGLALFGLSGAILTGIYTLYHHWHHKRKLKQTPGRNRS